MPHTVRTMAEQLDLAEVEMCDLLTRNTQRAFNLPAGFAG